MDNPGKPGLIHVGKVYPEGGILRSAVSEAFLVEVQPFVDHGACTCDLTTGASDLSASWQGNGLPRL